MDPEQGLTKIRKRNIPSSPPLYLKFAMVTKKQSGDLLWSLRLHIVVSLLLCVKQIRMHMLSLTALTHFLLLLRNWKRVVAVVNSDRTLR